MDPRQLRVAYLSGEHVYLRAPVKADAEYAAAWLETVYPVNREAAETILSQREPIFVANEQRLVVVAAADDRIVGGVAIVGRGHDWRRRLTFQMARSEPEADAFRAAALRLVVPWLRDDLEAAVVSVEVPTDQGETIAAAENLGMRRTARLREWYQVAGARVDAVCYEVLFPPWTAADA